MHYIKDIAERFNVTLRTIRYYESTLGLRINRDDKGARIYSDDDVQMLELIFELRDAGVGTDGMKKMLTKRGILNPNQEALEIIEQQPLLDALQDSILSRIDARMLEVEETLAEEINTLRSELQAVTEELATTREADRQKGEERDKQLMQALRAIQQRQEETPKKKSWKNFWKRY